jgi:two-component system, LytTR family, sensor kinase
VSYDRPIVRDRKRFAPLWVWATGFAVFTIFGLLELGYRFFDDLARDRVHTFPMRFFEEMNGAYCAAIFFPLVVVVARRWSLLKLPWYRSIPIHVTGMLTYGLLHTTLMALSRHLLAPLFNLGPYDYGIMTWRYPMEATKQITVYASWVAAITLFDYYRAARNREVATAELESRLAEAQLENLRLQLHPHFLFNTLNTISSVMYEDVERADAMLTRLSDLLRRTIRPTSSQEVPLGEELSLLELYVDLMRARFGDDLAVGFAVDAETRDALVPQLILQPLVENSIRYGGDPMTSRVDITVSAHRDNGSLLLQVSDHGPGMGASLQKGIGLSNTAGRLQSLYGDGHELVLQNADGGGFSATLRVPFRTAVAS